MLSNLNVLGILMIIKGTSNVSSNGTGTTRRGKWKTRKGSAKDKKNAQRTNVNVPLSGKKIGGREKESVDNYDPQDR